MKHHHLILCILIISAMLSSTTDDCVDRHRKPWHQLSTDEQMLYVNGFKELRNNGKLAIFIETHHLTDTPLSFANVHYTAQFFPWHSYFLTELESQIRAIGPEYNCFALPYWDFTNDADFGQANDMPIYNTVLGADGNEDNDYCVEDELWNRDSYPTTYLCSDTEKSLGIDCCLKRHHGPRGHIPSTDQLSPHIYQWSRFKDFQEAVVKEHTYVHGYISGNNNATHMFGHNAAEDPLFIMLHNFLMYIRAMRTSCFGYDKVINELEDHVPKAYDPYQSTRSADMKPFLDRAMDFNLLGEAEWSAAYSDDITIRKVFDLDYFDISYELGTFWHSNAQLQKYCSEQLNASWFYDDGNYDYSAIAVNRHNAVNNILYVHNGVVGDQDNNKIIYYMYYFGGLLSICFILTAVNKYQEVCTKHKYERIDGADLSIYEHYGSFMHTV